MARVRARSLSCYAGYTILMRAAWRIDGRDIREYRRKDLRRLFTVLTQEPARYSASAATNIALGDIGAERGEDAIERAARDGGAHEMIGDLARGYETLLGKSFAGGTELSGGEWQRLALAPRLLPRRGGDPARRAHERHGLVDRVRVDEAHEGPRPRAHGHHDHASVHHRHARGTSSW